MKEFNKIHQAFYCPAFSLFNYAGIQVRYEKNMFEYPMKNFIPYGNIFKENLQY